MSQDSRVDTCVYHRTAATYHNRYSMARLIHMEFDRLSEVTSKELIRCVSSLEFFCIL